MRQVQDEIFYHIQKEESPQFKKGDIIKTSDKLNPYTERSFEREFKTKMLYGDPIYLKTCSQVIHNNAYKLFRGVSDATEEVMKLNAELIEALKIYLNNTRELIFEEVRKEHFANYPSRYKSLFLIENDKKSLSCFWNYNKYFRTENKKIFKLKATGKAFSGYANLLHLETFSVNQYRQFAFDYWKGKKADKLEELLKDTHTKNEFLSETKETLFEGEAEVIDQLTIDELIEEVC